MKTIYCYGDSNTWGYDPRSLMGEPYPEHVRWTGILKDRSGCRIIDDSMNGRGIPDNRVQIDYLAKHLAEYAAPGEELRLWIMLGTNDLLTHPVQGAAYAAARMDRFLETLMRQPVFQTGCIQIRLISPPVLRLGSWVDMELLVEQSRRLGPALQAVAEKYQIQFTDAGKMEIPVLFDGVHFSEAGHRVFAEEMLPLTAL